MMGAIRTGRRWAGPTFHRRRAALGGAGAGRCRESESERRERMRVLGSTDREGRAVPVVRAPLGTGTPVRAAASGMDSEESSFVRLPPEEGPQGGGSENPEQLREDLEWCKELHRILEQDCANLQMAKEAAEQRTKELKKEEELLKVLEQKLTLHRDEERAHQIFTIKEENNRLRQEKQILENKLEELKKRVLWNNPMMMLSSLPEKKMIFKGLTVNKEDMNKLMLTPLIHYPLPGGSALITFEEAKVAQRIIEMREHTVELSCGELEELEQCRVQVQAVPVEIPLPSALEIRLTPSRRSILLSALPSLDIPREALLDKLELFFSKTKNGGSEVENREFLEDSDQVVLTFAHDGVAEPLIEKGHIQVPIGKGEYKVKISPCMSGDVSNLQLQPSRCPRTVLLLGIPDVLSEESMRDALEIHFQKASRGGGEVDALAYVPAGRTREAVFVEDTD